MAMMTVYNSGMTGGVASTGLMGNPLNLLRTPYQQPVTPPGRFIAGGIEIGPDGKPLDKRTTAQKLRDEYDAKTKEATDANKVRDEQIRAEHDKALALYDKPQIGTPGVDTGIPGLTGYQNYSSVEELMKKAAVGDVRQQAIARGVYNGTPALNPEAVKSGEVALKVANLNNNLIDTQRNYDMQTRAAKAGLIGNKAQYIEGIQDTYPDLNQLIELEKLNGAGTQAGLEAPMIGGGGGGMSNGIDGGSPYGLPFSPGMWGGGYTPPGRKPIQKSVIEGVRARQDALDLARKVGGKLPPLTMKSPALTPLPMGRGSPGVIV